MLLSSSDGCSGKLYRRHGRGPQRSEGKPRYGKLASCLQYRRAHEIDPGRLEGKDHLRDVIDPLQTVVTTTNAMVSSRGSAATPDDVAKSIDLSAFRRRMAGSDKDSQEFFDASVASLFRIVFAEVKAR